MTPSMLIACDAGIVDCFGYSRMALQGCACANGIGRSAWLCTTSSCGRHPQAIFAADNNTRSHVFYRWSTSASVSYLGAVDSGVVKPFLGLVALTARALAHVRADCKRLGHHMQGECLKSGFSNVGIARLSC